MGRRVVNVDPELRKRVEQIKSSPVQMYREAGDYSNRELVEGIVVSPDDIAAIEAVARAVLDDELRDAFETLERIADDASHRAAALERFDPAEAAHHRMVQPDHYQRWER
jgi:hypothetical protein